MFWFSGGGQRDLIVTHHVVGVLTLMKVKP
jgi:hypothetical protein